MTRLQWRYERIQLWLDKHPFLYGWVVMIFAALVLCWIVL